jgi:hypothetical protein
MWEVYSGGMEPFSVYSNRETMDRVTEGERLACPIGCTDETYKIMLHCWDADPAARPSFTDLVTSLHAIVYHTDTQVDKSHYDPIAVIYN